MSAPRETYFPAHASAPVVKLYVPDPRAQGTFEEAWNATLAKFREQHDGHPDTCAACRGEAVAR